MTVVKGGWGQHIGVLWRGPCSHPKRARMGILPSGTCCSSAGQENGIWEGWHGCLGHNRVVSQRHLLPAQGRLPQPSPHTRAHLQGRGRGCAVIRAAPSEARAFLPTLLPFPPRGKHSHRGKKIQIY